MMMMTMKEAGKNRRLRRESLSLSFRGPDRELVFSFSLGQTIRSIAKREEK